MTLENDFLPFAQTSTILPTQSAYAADPNTLGGRPSGILPATIFNKICRQASFGTAALALLIVDYASQPALDDGNLTGEFVPHLATAIQNLATTALSGTITTINGEISTINGTLATHTSEIGTNTGNISTINGEISTINGEISTINGEISTINGEISALQSGTQTVWIPASAMQPDGTTYPTGNIVQFGTNRFTLNALSFTNGVADLAYFSVAMPTSWNAGTVTAKFHWYGTTGSGSVVFGLSGTSIANGNSLDASFGTPQVISSAYVSANNLVISGATPAITIGGTPAAGNLVEFKVSRSASDSFSSLAQLIGLQLTYTATSAFG